MRKIIFSLLFITAFFVSAYGQRHGDYNEITLYSEYNMPLGQLNWTYKPALGVQLHYKKMREAGSWSKGFGFGLGYTKFENLADTLYYVVDDGGVDGVSLGAAIYSPLRIIIFSAALGANTRLGKNTSLDLGLDVGYYYGKRSVQFIDKYTDDTTTGTISRGTFVPKAGIAFNLNDVVSLTPYASYTFMLELGSTDPGNLYYNPNTGAFMYYWSAGVALNFSF